MRYKIKPNSVVICNDYMGNPNLAVVIKRTSTPLFDISSSGQCYWITFILTPHMPAFPLWRNLNQIKVIRSEQCLWINDEFYPPQF